MTFAELARRVRGREARTPSTRIVGIDGPSASGKTTFARQLAQALGADIVHLEDIYPGWDGLSAAPRLIEAHVTGPIGRNEPATLPRWNWEADRPGRVTSLAPGAELVIEGCGAASAVLRPSLSFIVWVEASPATRKARAISRDGEVFAREWERWRAQETTLWEHDPTRAHADLIVDSEIRHIHPEATDFWADG